MTSRYSQSTLPARYRSRPRLPGAAEQFLDQGNDAAERHDAVADARRGMALPNLEHDAVIQIREPRLSIRDDTILRSTLHDTGAIDLLKR
jgi:hypothetical protein